ncbi:hypothetical protein CBOM_05436 [Ceraceosorus bombacis]|uniref:Uncharacterized protein n=1 Tax=Ceraceosorus bombacis TaxID=401625 RepID=A0A0P1BS13_9BASI|nr:hypothetical protein CBOM_05436 [Ceraceosorus bombacis]
MRVVYAFALVALLAFVNAAPVLSADSEGLIVERDPVNAAAGPPRTPQWRREDESAEYGGHNGGNFRREDVDVEARAGGRGGNWKRDSNGICRNCGGW